MSLRLRRLALALLATALLAPGTAAAGRPVLAGTVDRLLGLEVGPFAVGHRGTGENLGEDPSRPVENTVAAVRTAFRAGLSVVEVDVQLTRDGEVAVFHDDLLPDFTCVNTLTLAELQANRPWVPSLQAVLNQARRLSGILLVELKAAAPLCDPHDLQEPATVAAVTRVVRRMAMTEQVVLTSLSPALLFLAAAEAPEIRRGLTVSGLQLLSAAEVEAVLGLPVTPIAKALALGLAWAEIGPVFRLPGYASAAQLLATALGVGAVLVEADLFLLAGAGAAFVEAAHGLGLAVLGFTAASPAEWGFLQSLGVDGIYVDDVRLGLDLQPPLP